MSVLALVLWGLAGFAAAVGAGLWWRPGWTAGIILAGAGMVTGWMLGLTAERVRERRRQR